MSNHVRLSASNIPDFSRTMVARCLCLFHLSLPIATVFHWKTEMFPNRRPEGYGRVLMFWLCGCHTYEAASLNVLIAKLLSYGSIMESERKLSL